MANILDFSPDEQLILMHKIFNTLLIRTLSLHYEQPEYKIKKVLSNIVINEISEISEIDESILSELVEKIRKHRSPLC